MSIIGLASERVARNAPGGLKALSGNGEQRPKTLTDALSAVAAYVPTEILTAYTLTLAVVSSKTMLSMSWYLAFLVLTPLFVWLVFAAKSKEQNRAFLSWRLWPWWESVAACIAFTAWSAALPQTAFARFDWYSSSVAAIFLTVTSGLLPLVGAVVTKSPDKPLPLPKELETSS